jgi:hypothetical protein
MTMKKIVGIMIGSALMLCTGTILAYSPLVEVSVVTERGPGLPLYRVDSGQPNTYRAYVEAIRGERYSIRVRNYTPYRVGLVVAVDGRNIISGKKSFLQPQERMYILDPYGWGYYDGWRSSSSQVNTFYFTDAGGSYAGAWGDSSAMGVIAVAAFLEQRPPEPPVYERREPYGQQDLKEMPKKSAPQAMRPRAETQPGTGYGEERYSPVIRVDFVPEPVAAERHFLKYEWRETLCRKGIVDCRSPQPRNRFWDENRGYAPPPPR